MLDVTTVFGLPREWLNQLLNNPFFLYYLLLIIIIIIALATLEKLNFKKLLECINNWLKEEKSRKGTIRVVIIFLILVFCFAGVLFIFTMFIMISNQITYSNALDDYFSIKYQNEIKPQSGIEISRIVNEVKPISNITEKLEKIAEWETKNFTDINWYHVSTKSLNPYANSYVYESTGKIRASRSYVNTPYIEDPYWIVYYKFGACGEEASLFANVTNQTGIITRPVLLDLGYWLYGIIPVKTGNHAFVEVLVNDTEWYYFDPTIYGADHSLNESACKNINLCQNRWFRKPDQYDYFLPDQVIGIYQGDTHEDISERYPKLSLYIINSKKPIRFDSGNRTMFPLDMHVKWKELERYL